METNKIIAEFMGGYEPEEFEDYHSDWNMLMQVVEKIEQTKIDKINYIDFHIMPDAVIVTNQDDEKNPLIIINWSECNGSIEKEFTNYDTKIKAVYNACLIFIKWYNENK